MQKSVACHLTRKELIADRVFTKSIGIITFLLLITLGAFVYIPLPFTPVPVTLQTFFVLLGAAFLTKKDSVFVQGLYAGLGAIGLPIFSAAQGGLLKLFGPTGGYILGFILAIFGLKQMLNYFSKKSSKLTYPQVVISMTIAMFGIYFLGGLWLAITLKFSFSQVIMLGVVPFIPGEVVKVLLAAAIYYKANDRLKNLFQN
ncbi:MAG: biotin transporter BioY [Candidatus Omnitrophica bacterium]|nr:biotin transporter BioY [Candidatus Omnitrophota bacterium]